MSTRREISRTLVNARGSRGSDGGRSSSGESGAVLSAVEVMIAGGHDLLIRGGPVWRSGLVKVVAGLLPELDERSAVELTRMQALVFGRPPDEVIRRAPLRCPHHTVSRAGLLGSGRPPRPGEVSLAHRGILVLDDLGAFFPGCVSGLLGPLDRGVVTLPGGGRLPARFSLLASVTSGASPRARGRDPARELVRRVALIVPSGERSTYGPRSLGEAVAAFDDAARISARRRIALARARQVERLAGTRWASNDELPDDRRALTWLFPLSADADRALERLASERRLDAGALEKLWKVARTLADLDASIDPGAPLTVAVVLVAAGLRGPGAGSGGGGEPGLRRGIRR